MANKLSFWEHLDELRATLIKIVIAFVIFLIAAFFIMPSIFDDIILAPCSPNFWTFRMMGELSKLFGGVEIVKVAEHIEIINIKLTSQLFTHLTTSLAISLIVGFPFYIYQVWKYLAPALYMTEQKVIKRVLISGTLMFWIGAMVGYFIIFPISLHFLIDYTLSSMVKNQLSLDSYMSNFFTLTLLIGLFFELPVVIWIANRFGLVSKSFLKRFRRHVIVGLLVTSAIITPSSDPVTLMLVFLPLYALYEASIIISKEGKSRLSD